MRSSAAHPACRCLAARHRRARTSLHSRRRQGFPTSDPLFKLIALGKKNIRIGVLGGSFTSGAPTIKLVKGKRLTLANQADGSRYVIQLLKLTTATPPPPPAGGSSRAPAGTTTAATTVTTTTTPAPTTTTSAG